MKKTFAEKIRIGLYSFVAIVVLLVISITAKVQFDKHTLLTQGVKVKGFIVQKSEHKGSQKRRSTSSYEFDLNLFVDTAGAQKPQTKPETFEGKMDALLAASKTRMQNQFQGGYAKVSIGVTGVSFKKYAIGQVVDVVHLKDKPDTAKLLEELE